MDSSAIVGIVIVGGAALTLLLIAFVKSNLRVCPPNEMLIFSGRKRKRDSE